MKVEDDAQFEAQLDFDRDSLTDYWPRYDVLLNGEIVGVAYLKRDFYGLKITLESREREIE